ncbi:MAG: hypothetical protein ACI902_002729 [Psychroserpens sp.]|jgi:hypothetical protein
MLKLLLTSVISLSGIYLWSSGLPQISHLLFILLTVIFFSLNGSLYFKKRFLIIIVFTIYAYIINFYFFVIGNDTQFVSTNLQLIFNVYILIFFYSILCNYVNSPKWVVTGIIIAFSIQWIVLLLGLGNYSLYPRYSGTFNDPNQMAYWLLCLYSMYLLLGSRLQYSRISKVFLGGSFFVFVILTISRSAFIAIVFFAVCHIAIRIVRSKRRAIQFIFFIISTISIGTFILQSNFITNDVILDRVLNVDFKKQVEERGYTRFVDHPDFIILGSGQGNHKRFNIEKEQAFLNVEMHTTWGGLLFYYGIIGFSLVLLFLFINFFNATPESKIIMLSTFVYGLSTYSFRTPVFWLLLAVFMYLTSTSTSTTFKKRDNK